MKSRHIKLSKSDKSMLKRIWHHDESQQARKRAHALLLSDKGENIGSLSKIFFVKRDTISNWLNKWENEGLQGLYDSPRSGRPNIFSEEEEKKY